jgi:hypothetical protein
MSTAEQFVQNACSRFESDEDNYGSIVMIVEVVMLVLKIVADNCDEVDIFNRARSPRVFDRIRFYRLASKALRDRSLNKPGLAYKIMDNVADEVTVTDDDDLKNVIKEIKSEENWLLI